jgi:hypothetical protein
MVSGQVLRIGCPSRFWDLGFIPYETAAKNKLQNPVPFSSPRKVFGNFPRFTSNSPQFHHDLPSTNTTKFAKYPTKTAFHHTQIFPSFRAKKTAYSPFK